MSVASPTLSCVSCITHLTSSPPTSCVMLTVCRRCCVCCLMCTCMCACVCVCLYVCVEVATCTLTCIKCVPCGAYVSSRLCVNALLCVFVFACAYACVAVLVRVVPMVARRPSARTPSRANRQVQTLGTSCTSNAGLKGSQQLFCGAPRRFVGDGFQHAAVLPSPAAHTTLDTRCTSTSGLKGSQPHFRPSLHCAVSRGVVCVLSIFATVTPIVAKPPRMS